MNKGQHYEEQAAEFLQQAGLKVLERNFSCKLGEIDIICKQQNTLVFVEVRYRRSARFGSASASITAAKQRRLLRTAALFLQRRHSATPPPCRFDVITFHRSQSRQEDEIQWLKNAITM